MYPHPELQIWIRIRISLRSSLPGSLAASSRSAWLRAVALASPLARAASGGVKQHGRRRAAQQPGRQSARQQQRGSQVAEDRVEAVREQGGIYEVPSIMQSTATDHEMCLRNTTRSLRRATSRPSLRARARVAAPAQKTGPAIRTGQPASQRLHGEGGGAAPGAGAVGHRRARPAAHHQGRRVACAHRHLCPFVLPLA